MKTDKTIHPEYTKDNEIHDLKNIISFLETKKEKLEEQLRIAVVSGRFCSDTNEDNKKILTGILYKHTDEKSMVIREIDYDEVINDIMEYF
jgi:hypothetical protein